MLDNIKIGIFGYATFSEYLRAVDALFAQSKYVNAVGIVVDQFLNALPHPISQLVVQVGYENALLNPLAKVE
ncbi:MAG: hypothetical protein ABI972_25650 [Acidobacteriota bacterium]